ncbi:hypothetical protein [Helicobacter sp. T3_23-1056]
MRSLRASRRTCAVIQLFIVIASNDSASVIVSVAMLSVAIYPLVIRQTFLHCEILRLCQKLQNRGNDNNHSAIASE